MKGKNLKCIDEEELKLDRKLIKNRDYYYCF